jgi:hypothetical protein
MAWIRNRPTGLVYHDEGRAFDGYAIVPQGEAVRLIDASGETAHVWPMPSGVPYARLLPDGTLLGLLGGDPKEPPQIANGEIVGLVEIDAAGRIVWEYHGGQLHHDAWRLEDGSYHVLGFEPLSRELSEAIRGGCAHADDPERLWGDTIEHIRRDGSRETIWRAADHLDPETQVICPLDSRKEWTHANSIRIMRDGSWLLSLRLTSSVVKLDRRTGAPLWTWGPGNTSHQHDARELEDGHVLIFDNGVHRERAPGFARVVEVDPATDEIVWQYLDRTILAFQSFMAGGAQRLPNGNTFITEAATGRLFQVTREGETVWEWVNPHLVDTVFGPTPVVFRSHWYARDDARVPETRSARSPRPPTRSASAGRPSRPPRVPAPARRARSAAGA